MHALGTLPVALGHSCLWRALLGVARVVLLWTRACAHMAMAQPHGARCSLRPARHEAPHARWSIDQLVC